MEVQEFRTFRDLCGDTFLGLRRNIEEMKISYLIIGINSYFVNIPFI